MTTTTTVETRTNGAAEPRDPHAMWWVEYQRLYVEWHNWHLIRGVDEDDEHDRMWGELTELLSRILTTEATTFEGFQVQCKVLEKEISGGHDYGRKIREAFRSLRCFVMEIGDALERRGLQQAMERAGWGRRCYEADAWKDHPAMPADVAAGRASNPPPA